MRHQRRHILLTGLPGVGKTTLIRKLAEGLAVYHPAGFYTEEIRLEGIRQGFRLVSLDGREQTLSHVNFTSRDRVGRYKVDVAGFEQFLSELDLSHAGTRLILIDEIGKMECLSAEFIDQIKSVLASSSTVIATVARKGGGFIEQVKQRSDSEVTNVTKGNRDTLVSNLVEMVQERLESQI